MAVCQSALHTPASPLFLFQRLLMSCERAAMDSYSAPSTSRGDCNHGHNYYLFFFVHTSSANLFIGVTNRIQSLWTNEESGVNRESKTLSRDNLNSTSRLEKIKISPHVYYVGYFSHCKGFTFATEGTLSSPVRFCSLLITSAVV